MKNQRISGRLKFIISSFSRPFHGLIFLLRLIPTTKVLGYYQSVRLADGNREHAKEGF